MNLTLQEAIALRDFLEGLCVSYYEVDMRSAIAKELEWLNNLIYELQLPEPVEEHYDEGEQEIQSDIDDIQEG